MRKNRAQFELSAGGIVINSKNKKILTIVDQKNRYTFPKGQVEKGEEIQKAAEREIKEETGIKNLRLLEKIGEVEFFYKFKGELIFKKIIYFLFETTASKLKPQREEIKKACWLKPKEFFKKNAFKNIVPIFKKALKLIKKYGI